MSFAVGNTLGRALRGRPKSEEYKAKMRACPAGLLAWNAAGRPMHIKRCGKAHPYCSVCRPDVAARVRAQLKTIFRPSKPQIALALLFAWSGGLQVELEQQFGRFRADIFLPECGLIVEVDGAPWHEKTRAYDARRDAEIEERFGFPTARFDAREVENALRRV